MAGRAVIYARSSTKAQTTRQTTRYQIEACRAFASSLGLDVVAELVDEAVSGNVPVSERAAGCELLDMSTKRRCEVVLVFRLDRLARLSGDLIRTDRVLRDARVELISVEEPEASSGELALQSVGDFAERELVAILQRMSEGRDRAAREGRWTNGPIPFGYDLDEGGVLIPSQRDIAGTPEADLARSVFERIAAGSSTVAEARRLQDLGVFPGRRYPTRGVILSTGRWLPSRVNQMVKNTLYVGRHTQKGRNGVIEREVPALVDIGIWRQAQAALTKNRGSPSGFARRTYLLRGLVVCAGCGCGFGGTPSNARGSRNYYYRCNGCVSSVHPNPDDRCRAKHVPAEWLETLVWEQCVTRAPELMGLRGLSERRIAIERLISVIGVATIREGRRKKRALITISYVDGDQSIHELRTRLRRR